MLLEGGSHGGRRYFSEETVRRMYTNQIPHLRLSTGLGWELNQPRFMGRYCSANTFGKTGFTGCYCLCDPEKGLGLVLLSNCIYPARAPDREAINALRRDIADLVFSHPENSY
jgi:CubicO group peptidase (beta-lactamase class C family)